MSNSERYQRIKNWLMGYDKFVVNEREDNNFHFSLHLVKKFKKALLLYIVTQNRFGWESYRLHLA